MNIESELKLYGVKTLAGMLGALDSLFEPRNHAWPDNLERDQANWQRRRLWLDDGLFPFKNPGNDPAERKTYARTMSELEKAGLVKTGAREHVGLSTEGLSTARQLCRRLQLADVLPGIDYIHALIGGPHEWTDDPESGWFSEASLCGFDPWPRGVIGKPRLPDSAYWATDALIPLLIAGYVDFDFRPEFELPLYRLTDSGKKLALSRKKSGATAPSGWLQLSARERPEPPPAYIQGWQTMASFLQTAPPLRTNWITHHLSVNIYPRQMLTKKRRQVVAVKNRK